MAKSPSKSTSKPSKTSSKSKSLRTKTKAVSTRPTAAMKPKATPKVVAGTDAAPAAGGELKKKELIERIASESGMKKGEIRTALDATLRVLGDALREGRDISAAPLGKLKVKREKLTPNGKLVVCRVKLKDPTDASDNDPLAGAAE